MNPEPDSTIPPREDVADPAVGELDLPTRSKSASPSTPSTCCPGKFGRYQIQKEIGRGGMGAVYLALDTLLDRRVALKIPNFAGNKDIAAARFLREAQSAAGLHHPNICPIYDVGEIGGMHFLCMAFIEGEQLSNRFRPDRPLDPKQAVSIIQTVALAMQTAHVRGVIHRDLKPANIMMDGANQPIILDFGLARRRSERVPSIQLTVQGEFMGTPAYMPPEQVAGDVASMGSGSDIYSLGVILYELLTGETPFRGDFISLVSQIALDPPLSPSSRRASLDSKFDSICLKALAKRPEDRWQSMQAFADALATLATPSMQPAAGLNLDAPSLTLKVQGTTIAYRPPPILPTISVGRQKRKPGEALGTGNDFVLRVAGNEALSARISRRHFELHRSADGYALVDKSKSGVTRNGQPVPKETLVPLAHGDLLCVAGIVTLEVSIGTPADPNLRRAAMAEIPAPAHAGGGQVQIEASVGDMMTLE